MYIELTAHVLITSVTFEDNHDGGAIILGDSKAVIQNCSFLRNVGVMGGAITTKGDHDIGILNVVNTSFIENSASAGAIMHMDDRNTLIQSCHFRKNKAAVQKFEISTGERVRFHHSKGFSVVHIISPAATVYSGKYFTNLI